MAAGLSRPTAEASAAVEAHYYETLAARFGGALGTAEDLYRARAARVVGPGQAAPTEGPGSRTLVNPQPITRTEPLRPPTIRSIADIQAQDGVGATQARRTQEREILARGRLVEPGTPRAEPVVARPAAPAGPLAPEEAQGVRAALSAELAGQGGALPPAAAERIPEEVAQAPAVPQERPRLRSGADIAREDGIKDPAKIIAVQNQEMIALADWQAAHPSGEPRPRRNRAADRLAETAGIPTAGVPEPAVLTEIVDRLPEERVVEEVNAAAEAGEIEYVEAEKVAETVAPEVAEAPDQFYDADQSRPLEELESEHRPANEAAAPEQREGGGGEPIPTAEGARPVPEGGGPVEPVGGAGGRAANEAGERGDVEHAVAAAGVEPAYHPEPAAEPATGPAAGEAEPRRVDARGNPIFAKGERVVIPDGEHLAGRHGTVETANGLVFQSLYGGERSAPTYSYEVRTDAGELVHVVAPVAETGERPAVVPDPIYQGHARNPAELLRHIGLDERAATGYVARGARARTGKMKAEWAREAANSRAKATAQRAVLDAWAAEHPEEAAKVLPPPAAVPEPPKAETAPAGGMSIVETRHTKTGEPLFVATGGPRVERAEYDRMAAEAKEQGGRWSSFRGHGAIPGWTFKTREGAEAFLRGGEGVAEAPTFHPSSHAWSVALADVLKKEGQLGASDVFNDLVRINELNPAQRDNLLSYARAATGDPDWTPTVPTAATPTAPAAEWNEVGKNADGETIYANAQGAHSVIENGVRVTETVALRPARDERTGRISYVPQIKMPGSKDLRFEVVPEAPRREYATFADPGEQAAHNLAIDALNGDITDKEAMEGLARLVGKGSIGEGFALVNLNRLSDWSMGEWEAAKADDAAWRAKVGIAPTPAEVTEQAGQEQPAPTPKAFWTYQADTPPGLRRT